MINIHGKLSFSIHYDVLTCSCQSIASHNTSRSSQKSGARKYISKKSEVDETLFGSYISEGTVLTPALGTRKTAKTQFEDPKKAKEVEAVKKQVHTGKVTNPNAVIIPQSELQRMRVHSSTDCGLHFASAPRMKHSS